ncbi:ArnT family glycosyltransferase [Schlesneria paludicola]|uniref:ArnT family glycosyltransferase n=1 Tax=Schlesneria paludicola TaxID=360056 RepID=UPI00029AFB99|nr:glycosyltransferase family 39 protein [Schlesneria paludicola]
MNVSRSHAQDLDGDSSDAISSSAAWWLLGAICLLFLAIRIPVMYLQPGGMDEECYAVPGWMIARTGVPSLPHVPARNAESVYYHAEQGLYSEPPVFFYFQSLFFLALPPVYGTGRLAAAVAGIALLGLMFQLMRSLGARRSAALWAVLLYSLSRCFFFPAMRARPEMLCAVFGLLAMECLFRWIDTKQIKWLGFIGICIGLGGLTHPFAIVYAVQLAVWTMIVARGWQRLLLPTMLAVVAVAVTATWLPLIWPHPDVFRIQFHNQFIHDAGGGLFARMLNPWESFAYHWFRPVAGLVPHLGLWQIGLALAPLVWVTAEAVRYRDRRWLPICLCAWTSMYLICVLVGPHHQITGYWCYTGALMYLCVGRAVGSILSFGHRWKPLLRTAWMVGVSGVLLVSLVPGAGLRAVATLVWKRNNLNYNAPAFADHLIRSLPRDAAYAVDTEFVFDFIAHERQAVWALMNPTMFLVDQYPFDYLIVSRFALDSGLVKGLPVVLERTFGDRDDLFACYCEVYRRVGVEPAPNDNEQ